MLKVEATSLEAQLHSFPPHYVISPLCDWSDGQLKDAADIQWFNDPDDNVPMLVALAIIASTFSMSHAVSSSGSAQPQGNLESFLCMKGSGSLVPGTLEELCSLWKRSERLLAPYL